MAERAAYQALMARSPEPVAEHDHGRARLALTRPQRGHGMEVDQQRCAPFGADPVKLPGQRGVVGAVDA